MYFGIFFYIRSYFFPYIRDKCLAIQTRVYSGAFNIAKNDFFFNRNKNVYQLSCHNNKLLVRRNSLSYLIYIEM